MGEWLLSRRDRLIVARHEVPGMRRRESPVPYGYCFIAPGGLKNLVQDFNPGKHPIKRFALKGREMAWAKYPSNATEKGWGIS